MKSLGEKSHKYRLERFGKERTSYLKKYLGNKKNKFVRHWMFYWIFYCALQKKRVGDVKVWS